jgi:ribonuclease BN (tRNA processing enzyme)
MMKFEINILGCGAALPTSKRSPTAQVVQLNEQLFLVDCGEGTQAQLRKMKIKFLRIDHIFISHLHGDHYLGLPGLISSMHLLGRKKDINIYGPKGIDEIMKEENEAKTWKISLLRRGQEYKIKMAKPLSTSEVYSVEVMDENKLSLWLK